MTTKEELRRQLENQVSQHLEQQPDAVTLYAAARKPDRQPWKKRPSLLDQAFNEELAKAEREIQKKREQQ
jgi:hypothetical protein